MNCLVTGAGGFIGGHLTKRLLAEGHAVRAVDIKPVHEWWQLHPRAENIEADLSKIVFCEIVCRDMQRVYSLAADMGGMGHIETHKADCMLNVLINTHMLLAAKHQKVERYFYSSSACVYAADKQDKPVMPALKEADAYPAMPEDGYGWEKLFTERMARHFREDYGVETRVARFHNVYGTHEEWTGGREKAPTALSRKVAEVKLGLSDGVTMWGDGSRVRSFMWIDDCIEGVRRIMDSRIRYPINLGTSEAVTISDLLNIVEDAAGIEVKRSYDMTKPQGVQGRNSDNTAILRELGWEPRTPLREGIPKTYAWVEKQVAKHHALFI